jgi:D-alanyl-lipoteichoic acid acyltransferase DltB (MBOAT superfamily)
LLFNSFEFLVFFPLVAMLYFALPHRARWGLLLIASYVFYMWWEPAYALLILASTCVDYVAALRMGATHDPTRRRICLFASLGVNLGLLFSFKYFNFFNASLRAAFDGLGLPYGVPALDVLLPVGISFYTFQTLSYTIDVYRGARAPERHFGVFALYVSFFTQLVAGPIERSTHLLPQFRVPKRFDAKRVTSGLVLMGWGFFKKLVIADRLALVVDAVYAEPGTFYGPPVWIATYFFAFQIYCDFSGYSDIAVGGARVLGFDLMRNFERPYAARSIQDFWRRWHVSLTSWFRDYLYIPLGGNAPGFWVRNIVIVFLLSGLWHGANWTFVVWGAMHAGYLLVGVTTRGIRDHLARVVGLERLPRLRAALQVLVTFHLVLLAWVFFRAQNLGDAWAILESMVNFDLASKRTWVSRVVDGFDLFGCALAIIVMELAQWHSRRSDQTSFEHWPVWLRWPAYQALALAIILFGIFNRSEFIYFQF